MKNRKKRTQKRNLALTRLNKRLDTSISMLATAFLSARNRIEGELDAIVQSLKPERYGEITVPLPRGEMTYRYQQELWAKVLGEEVSAKLLRFARENVLNGHMEEGSSSLMTIRVVVVPSEPREEE